MTSTAKPQTIGDRIRAELQRAAEGPATGVFTPEECAWLRTRDGLAFDAEHWRDRLAGCKAWVAELHRAADGGVTLASELTGWAHQQTPAKRRWVIEEVVPLVEAWAERVEAAYRAGQP